MPIKLFLKILVGLMTAGLVAFTIWFFNATVMLFENQKLELPHDFVYYEKTDTEALKADQAFEEGIQFLKEDRWLEATRSFEYIQSFKPDSKHFREARRILGELNLDEFLSVENKENKINYTVKRGDSYLRIAKQNQTTLDAIMMMNSYASLPNLYPDNELVILPLNLTLVVDMEFGLIQLWDGGRWLKDYLIQKVDVEGVRLKKNYKITNKIGFDGVKGYNPRSSQYRNARKSLALNNSIFEIGSLPTQEDQTIGYGFFLLPEDMEELSLLLRLGNEVEIRF